MWFIGLCIHWCLCSSEYLNGGKVALIYYGSVALTFTVRQKSLSRRNQPGRSGANLWDQHKGWDSFSCSTDQFCVERISCCTFALSFQRVVALFAVRKMCLIVLFLKALEMLMNSYFRGICRWDLVHIRYWSVTEF